MTPQRIVTSLITAALTLVAALLAGAMLSAVSFLTAIVVLAVIAGAGLAALAIWAVACENAARYEPHWSQDITTVLARVKATSQWETALERWDRTAGVRLG
jgi:hypothetical protein